MFFCSSERPYGLLSSFSTAQLGMFEQESGLHVTDYLGGGFKCFLCSSLFGEDFQFDQYFSKGLKPPTSHVISRGKSIVLWSNNFDVR